ncbi:MAG: arylsulfatase [Mariniphaga sp.]|nr:arylsulfatase [Mariniphaga sp.]
MNRNIYLLGVVSLLLQSSLADGKPGQKKPNIIFILADDLGYGDISCLNENGKIHTPNIDMIAQTGITFTDAHSSSAVCTPSRYGILTGRYNWRSRLKNGVLNFYDHPLMSAERTNMASMLKQNGYQTACFGKWHLGWNWPTIDGNKPVDNSNEYNLDFSKPITGGPVDVGFDYFFGVDAPNYPPFCFIENRQTVGIPTLYFPKHPFGDCRPGRGIPSWNMEDILPVLQQKVVDCITAAAKKEAPFFIYFPITGPHTPIAPSKEFQGKSGLNAYADFVLEIDHLVGEIEKTLQENHLLENTILVFTSDNGCSPQADFPFLAEHGHQPSYIYRGHKADLFEGGHRIPCLMQWPAKIKEPHTVSQTICLIDFMATFANMVGHNPSDNEAEDSYNLLPAILNPGFPKSIREATVHHSINGSFTIRKGEWKLLLSAGSGGWSSPKPGKEEEGLPPVQLYNMKSDPAEKDNVQEKYTEVVKQLTDLLRKYVEEGRSTSGKPQKNDGEYPWHQIIGIIKN